MDDKNIETPMPDIDTTQQADTTNPDPTTDNQTADNSDEIQKLNQKLAELNDKYIRTYSEYENYRKRTAAEKASLILNGSEDTIKAILPVVDDFERAIAALPDDDKAKEGVVLIYKKLVKILNQKGLKEIEVKGAKFDEEIHEAVAQCPAADKKQKGTVLDVVEKGYYLNDKVLRHPKVVVAV
ncbi:MAG: nucleotide exchange factor GrpE [Bacteroidales bacterium]|nr:nucleotide exchange factor GrpE [Bacteroidales bacterium]